MAAYKIVLLATVLGLGYQLGTTLGAVIVSKLPGEG